MNRAAGTGLMAFGLVLVVLGAILDFAVSVTTTGFNINTVGLILLIVGIVGFFAGLMVVLMASSHRTTLREEERTTPTGRQRFVDERDNLTS